MSILKTIRSFKFAFRGIYLLIRNETNAQIHVIATGLVIIAGFVFKISIIEWLLVLLNIGIVLSAEAFNTSIEILADKITKKKSKKIAMVKDIAAGSVLISAIIALITGCIIFVPKIIKLF